MKISELKENIRVKVREALTVKLAGGTALTAPQKSAKITQLRTTTGDQTIGTEKNPIDFVKENDKIKPGFVDTKTLFNVKLKNGTIYKNVRFHMLNDPKSFVTSDGGYRINQDIQSVVNANQELKETEEDIKPGEYTIDKIYKMNRAELIDFTGLTPQDAAKYSTRTLQSIALEMADDRPADEEPIDEEDFMDEDDDTIIEDVEDVDSSGDGMAKYYDEVYEINANVAPGSRYQIEVRKDGNFIILTQDNGQEIVINPEDVRDLVKVILKIDNESN